MCKSGNRSIDFFIIQVLSIWICEDIDLIEICREKDVKFQLDSHSICTIQSVPLLMVLVLFFFF